MKRIAILLGSLLLITMLAGCRSEGTNTENQTTRANIEPGLGGVVVESGTKGVSDTNYMNSFWWGFNFETSNLNDGVYRGGYIFPEEVTVQFTINNNIISNLEYLRLGLEGKDYLNDETFEEIRAKYEAVLQYLDGKDIRVSLSDLHSQEKMSGIADNSIEVGKIISAIHDAFNRGIYYTNAENNK